MVPCLRFNTYLWVLVDLLSILLIAVDVEPHSRSSAASAAQPEDDARAIGEDEPQALGREEQSCSATCPSGTQARSGYSLALLPAAFPLLASPPHPFTKAKIPLAKAGEKNVFQGSDALLDFRERARCSEQRCPIFSTHLSEATATPGSTVPTWFLETLPSTGSWYSKLSAFSTV